MNQTKPNQTKFNFINAILLQLVSVFMFLIFSPLFFISCSETSILESDGLTESENKINKQEITPVTKGGITFKKMSETHISLYDKFLENVMANSNVTSAISAAESKSENGTLKTDELLYDVLNNMLTDKIKVSRAKGEEETQVIDFTKEFFSNYASAMAANAPDPSDALTLPGVTKWEKGIVVDGDNLIVAGSVEGALTIELLNAEARGESIQPIVDEIEKLNAAMFPDTDEKGVYYYKDKLWSGGVIYFQFDANVPKEVRNATRNAMGDWTWATTYEIQFVEIFGGIEPRVTIKMMPVDNFLLPNGNPPGMASIGYGTLGQFFLFIREDFSSWDLEKKNHVLLHELGHTIGLQHEHQRWDRDEFLNISSYGYIHPVDYEFNFAKRPYSGQVFSHWIVATVWKKKKVGWVTINYPTYQIIERTKFQQQSFAAGSFDFDSIMLYSGIEIWHHKRTLGNSDRYGQTKYNSSISYGDSSDVLLIYNK